MIEKLYSLVPSDNSNIQFSANFTPTLKGEFTENQTPFRVGEN